MHDEVWGCAEILPLPLSPNITLLILFPFCHTILGMFVQRIWFWINFFPLLIFFFFSFHFLVWLIVRRNSVLVTHSWELSNYWFFFRFLVALFPASRLIKVWYEEPFLFSITSMNVRVPTLLLSQLIEYIYSHKTLFVTGWLYPVSLWATGILSKNRSDGVVAYHPQLTWIGEFYFQWLDGLYLE